MKQLTLGELIEALKKQEPDKWVRFDFCYFRPSGLHSYRGYYEQLAIDYTEGLHKTVLDLLNMLQAAVGADFYGYKGGNYRMTEDTPVWVDKPSDVSGTAVVGVRDNGHAVILETANID